MTEWELPELKEVVRVFDATAPVFAEYCLAGPLVCARTHARILGKPEADHLSNSEFAAWYEREVIDDAALERVVAIKNKVRRFGYAGTMPEVKQVAEHYFQR